MILIIDALAHGKNTRKVTVDLIGAGPRTIAGVIESQGHETRIAPATVYYHMGDSLREYDAVFISGMVSDREAVKRIVSRWRKKNRDKPVVIGGPITADPNLLSAIGADIIVYGEAEKTVSEIIKTTSLPYGRICPAELEHVRGIIYTRDGRAFRNPPRPLMHPKELSEYRPSTQRITDYPGYWFKRVYVEVVRGCSNFNLAKRALEHPNAGKPRRFYPGCAYCSVPSLWGGSRSLSIKRIVQDVENLISEGVHRIVLSAPDILDYGREEYFKHKRMATNPTIPGANLEKLEKMFSELHSVPEIASKKAHISIENIKPCLVDEETAKLLGKYFRGTSINVGVETADDKLLARMGRPCGYKESLKALELLSKNGLKPHVYLIYGLPDQHPGIIRKTIKELNSLRTRGVEKITLYRFTPIPNSMLENALPGDPTNKHNRKLIMAVKRYNLEEKKKLVGKILEAVIVSGEKNGFWGYLWPEGPVIYASATAKKTDPRGKINKIKITGAKNERVLKGIILREGEKIYRESLWQKNRIYMDNI